MISDLQKALTYFNTDKHQWYGWKNIADGEVYSNLKLNDETAVMPTEEEINAKIAELTVIRNRQDAYGSIADQLDMQYWDNVNGTTTWKDHIAQVKADNPKP
tara:strand:+ start:129 stop:434 length:306 start_codon:yes stop_codon:yes gene_type:complete